MAHRRTERSGAPNPRHLVWAAALAAACVLGFWWVSDRAAAPPPEVQAEAGTSASGLHETADGRRFADTLDAVPVLSGRYRIAHRSTLQLPNTRQGPRDANTVLTGQLDVGDGLCPKVDRCLVMRLVDAKLQTSKASAALGAFAATDREDAAAMWVVDIDRIGRVQNVRVAPGVSTGLQRIVADLSYALQFVRANRGRPAGWTASEDDVNGRYLARYKRISDAAVSKRWQDVQHWHPNQPTGEPIFAATGEARFVLASGRVGEVSVVRKGSAAVGGAATRASFDGEISLKTDGPAQNDWLAAVQVTAWLPWRATSVKQDRTAHAAAYGRLVAALEDERASNMTDRMVIGRELTVVLASDPAAVSAAEHEIGAGDKAEPVRRTLLEALAGAGTDLAQAAVARLVGREMPGDRHNQVLVAAAQIARPNAELVGSVAKVAVDPEHDERGSRAAIAWGAMLGTLRQAGIDTARQPGDGKQPDFYAEASRRLNGGGLNGGGPHGGGLDGGGLDGGEEDDNGPQDGTGKQVDIETQANWLDALGNTRSPKAFALIAAALFHPRAVIRSAAANALRFQDPGKAVPLMTRRMLVYDTIAVRRGILHAALWMGPAECETLVAKALHYDASPAVRENAAFTIASWAEKSPGLRRHLVEALEHEDSPTVERTLRNYLEPGRVPAGMNVTPLAGGAQ